MLLRHWDLFRISRVPHVWRWKRIMARAVLVVAVGAEVLDECTSRFGVNPARAIMIPNGRDPSLFHPGSEESGESPTLAFVGALTEQKQPGRFIEVVKNLLDDGSAVRAMIIGDGPLAGELAEPAAALGIDVLGSRHDIPEIAPPG